MSNENRINELKKFRRVIKSKLTLFKKFSDGYERNPDINSLILRYNKIKTDVNSFEVIQSEMESLHADFESQLAERNDFKEGC